MKLIGILSSLLAISACSNFQLREGDLLFQDIDCGEMCEAIESVTNGVNNANFSHIALIVNTNDNLYALEAISQGVVLTPINTFLNRSLDKNNKPKVVAGRLKKQHRHIIPKAIEESVKLLGMPYNDEFLMDNNKYYCSELIYETFKKANNNIEVFTLQPMTFKSPGSNNYFPIWEEYFKEIGMPIPEGEPGINPGSISKSKRIKILHKYGQISGWD